MYILNVAHIHRAISKILMIIVLCVYTIYIPPIPLLESMYVNVTVYLS